MHIRPLDPHDEAAARLWYAVLHASASHARIAPLVVSEVSLLTSLRSNDTNPNKDRQAFGAWADGRCLGTALLELPRLDNTHLAEIEVNVAPAERGRGIGGALFDAVLGQASRYGRTTVTCELNIPYGQSLQDSPGGRFALARGFASQHSELRLLLDLPLTEQALTALEGVRNGGYEVVTWTGLAPERWIEAFARMRTLMERDVPSGSIDRTPVTYDAGRVLQSQKRSLEQGFDLITALVLDPAGEPAAYSTMFVMPGREHVMQDDTFVLRAHRGHRLGTLAKVANLRQLFARYPGARYVHTWTAEVNDAMRAINDRFGFRAVETMHEVELGGFRRATEPTP